MPDLQGACKHRANHLLPQIPVALLARQTQAAGMAKFKIGDRVSVLFHDTSGSQHSAGSVGIIDRDDSAMGPATQLPWRVIFVSKQVGTYWSWYSSEQLELIATAERVVQADAVARMSYKIEELQRQLSDLADDLTDIVDQLRSVSAS